MGKYFGTDGFRGEANVALTVDHAFKVGRYLGYYYNKQHKENDNSEQVRVVIGKDTRRSSYMFEYALAAGITASGADAYLLHVTTTPSVSFVVRSEGFDCGIMISASHNPYYDNGIKLINSDGIKMEAEVEALIEAYIDDENMELPLAKDKEIGRTVDHSAGRNRYIGHLISLATRSFKNKRIGLDCANGSASSIAKSVFDALGAKTYVINNEPNGFNINVDAGSTHIEILQDFVLEKGLDVGFAYDGDADRCIAVDENGNIIDGDLILYACGRYMHENGLLDDNTIVTTIMSNLGLYKALDKLGIDYKKTAVGDKYVYEEMVRNGYRLGGEQSGHIIFSKYETTGDGILTSLMLMEAMLEKKQSLSKLVEDVKIYPQILKNIKVADKEEYLNNPTLKEEIKAVEADLKDNGRVLVRKSGTEPLVRLMVEAKDIDTCNEMIERLVIAGEGRKPIRKEKSNKSNNQGNSNLTQIKTINSSNRAKKQSGIKRMLRNAFFGNKKSNREKAIEAAISQDEKAIAKEKSKKSKDINISYSEEVLESKNLDAGKDNTTVNKLDPILKSFLEMEDSYERYLLVKRYQEDLRLPVLISMELSLDGQALDTDNLDEHINYVLKILDMKRKYEESRLRK